MKVICRLLVLITLIISSPVSAQLPDAVALEKANKDMMKSVKKKANAAKVWIEVAPDGYWYYRVSAKKNEGPYGAYDQNGNVIVPLNAYNSFLEYLPAMKAGRTRLPRGQRSVTPGEFELAHFDVKGTFLGRSPGKTSFIALDGTVTTAPDAGPLFAIYPGWVVTNTHPGTDDMHALSYSSDFLLIPGGAGDPLSLYTADGQLYLGDLLEINIDKDQNLKYSKIVDGVAKQGLKNLEDPDVDIPCEYAGIIAKNGKYLVNETSNSKQHEYVKGESNKIKFRDEGERLYEKGDWPGVIEYYADAGADAPWAKFFSGSAMLNLGSSDLFDKVIYIENVNKGNWERLNNKFYKSDAKSFDLPTDIELILAAKELLESYLQNGDNTFAQDAGYKIDNCDEYLTNQVPFVRENYDKALSIHRNHNMAESRKIEEERQRNQQSAMMFVGLVNNIVSSVVNSSGHASKSSRAAGSTPSGSSVSAVPAASGSRSSVDNSSRKGFLKGQIIEWKSKLKKAEASRQQVFDDYQRNPSPAAKRALDSKENTVNECLNMIRQYESELNSL